MKRLTLIFGLLCALAVLPVQAQDAASDLFGRINALRTELGLHPYTSNAALAAAAQDHASWMLANQQVSHTQDDGSTPSSRAARVGYPSSAVSENIYMGSNASAGTAWNWWLNSPIHYRGITNANYTEIGIGVASDSTGAAFVLVFGNPNGWGISPAAVRGAANNDDGGGIAAAPSFIVGVDNFGNIMHEIQLGQTLGEIALVYGYDWDDLEMLRGVNEMTEAEGRNLSIGGVLLVPPFEGTYTPTPGGPPPQVATAAPESTDDPMLQATTPPDSTVNEDGIVRVGALLGQHTAVPPRVVTRAPDTPVPTITPTERPWQAATVTPSVTATPPAVAANATDPAEAIIEPVSFQAESRSNGPSTWLIAAVVLQVVILGIAAVVFIRQTFGKG